MEKRIHWTLNGNHCCGINNIGSKQFNQSEEGFYERFITLSTVIYYAEIMMGGYFLLLYIPETIFKFGLDNKII